MFEKFTDKARKVMSLAQDEARSLGKMYVGTEHLLLALIKEGEGIAAQALAKLDVTYEETIATVRSISSEETFGDSTDRIVPFESGALATLSGRPVVMEFAMRDADLYSFRFAKASPKPPVFLRGKIADIDRLAPLNPLFPQAFAFLKRPDLASLAPGRYPIAGNDCWAEIVDCPTRGYRSQNSELEVHRRFIEIHAPLSAREGIGRLDLVRGEPEKLDYDAGKDIALFRGPVRVESLVPGDYAIFFPPFGAHMPCISLETDTVRKAVVHVRDTRRSMR